MPPESKSDSLRIKILENELRIKNRELEDAQETIRNLKQALFGNSKAFPFEWGLSATEAQVMCLLLNNDTMNKTAAVISIYASENREMPGERIIDVFISKIRQKLKNADIPCKIHTVHGQGWQLDAKSKAHLKQLLKDYYNHV